MSLGEIGPKAPSLGSTLRAGIAGRCPACHHGKLYSGYLAVAPKCNVCGLDYAFADSGDGPAVFVILVTGFVVTGLALIAEILYTPPYWLHAALWGPLAVLLPLVLLRSFKGRAHRAPVQAQGRRGQTRLRMRLFR